jgi:hypothetical protein
MCLNSNAHLNTFPLNQKDLEEISILRKFFRHVHIACCNMHIAKESILRLTFVCLALRGLLYGTDLISFKSILDYCFRIYFGTAMYVDYLMFSHLNPITNPTPQPNATLTIRATARSPNYRGSRVYPNYRGSYTQP